MLILPGLLMHSLQHLSHGEGRSGSRRLVFHIARHCDYINRILRAEQRRLLIFQVPCLSSKHSHICRNGAKGKFMPNYRQLSYKLLESDLPRIGDYLHEIEFHSELGNWKVACICFSKKNFFFRSFHCFWSNGLFSIGVLLDFKNKDIFPCQCSAYPW